MDEISDFEKHQLTLERTVARLASSKNELEAQKMLYDELEKQYKRLQDDHALLKDAVDAAY